MSVDRRRFIKNAAGVVASAAAVSTNLKAEQTATAAHVSSVPPAPPREEDPPREADVLTTERSGSDDMVDIIKALGIEFITTNPGSSFRGLHEAIINYGGNSAPELITCLHEESSVAMGHGYAKIAGKPLGVMAHGTVGLQHASMAVYNAYCDRVPVVLIVGNSLDATMRRPGVEWAHSVQDAAAMVRDYTKWDDMPISMGHFAESAVRAYKIAMTPPMGPVLLVADTELQEHPVTRTGKFQVPKLTLAAPPAGDSGSVAETARLLVGAENPVIVADRAARTPEGVKLLIELAELLQASVVDQGGRMNFPSRHPLNQSIRGRDAVNKADVILALEVWDVWGQLNSFRDQLHRSARRTAKPDVKVISITSRDLSVKPNYQEFQRYAEIDVSMAADAEATLPGLIDAVKRLLTDDRRRVHAERAKELQKLASSARERTLDDASYGWDASPITTARLAAEVWAQIQKEDWSLVSQPNSVGAWPMRLWNFDRPYQFTGGSGGSGVGYLAPAAVGVALANRAHGRLTVNFQPDGDLMYAPGVLWTAAHHKIPLLNVMCNNRSYHQEVMHIQRLANRHNRGPERAWIGTIIDRPAIDYAQLAKSMGLYAEGPITNPNDVGPALARAIAVVKKGEPALIDVVTEPR